MYLFNCLDHVIPTKTYGERVGLNVGLKVGLSDGLNVGASVLFQEKVIMNKHEYEI